jgi:hypothetical protein
MAGMAAIAFTVCHPGRLATCELSRDPWLSELDL